MTFLTVLTALTTIVGSVMAFSGAPQALKIFRRKSAGDISALTYSILMVGAVVWIAYGIAIRSLPVVISNGIGFFMAGAIVVGCFLYPDSKK